MPKFLMPILLYLTLTAATTSAIAIEIKEIKSKSGIIAWLVEDHSNPIITISFSFRGGAATDPKGKEGLASLTSRLMDEGAGDLNSNAFQKILNDETISISFNASKDSFHGKLKTLVRSKTIAFKLLKLALTRPRFDKEPFERIRSSVIIKLKNDLKNPKVIAGRRLMSTIFPDHPYGRPTDGYISSIKNIKPKDLENFVSKRLSSKNIKIGIVGAIHPKEAELVVDKIFSSLPKSASSWKVPSIRPILNKSSIFIDQPYPQSSLLFALAGVQRSSPNFYPTYILNHIFGGAAFTSRLYQEIREKRGLVYSVGSFLSPYESSSITLISAGTKNKNVQRVINVIEAELVKISTHGITEKELINAKLYLTGSFPLKFSSSNKISSMLVALQMEELGITYLKKRNPLIQAVSIADVNKMASKILKKDNLVKVIVGNIKNKP